MCKQTKRKKKSYTKQNITTVKETVGEKRFE